MSEKFDFEKAAEAEVVGALAIRAGHRNPDVSGSVSPWTPSQGRVLADLARSLVQSIRKAGAVQSPIIINNVSFELHRSASEEVLCIRTATPKRKLIAIGTRGTAFASLTPEQMQQVRLNRFNEVFDKPRRSSEQKAKRDNGDHQDVLWADSCSWLTPRGGEFWIGTLDEALAQRLVRKVKITANNRGSIENLQGYLRADFDVKQERLKDHKVIAVDTEFGRIELEPVLKENGKGKRNALYLRKVVSIEAPN